MSLFGAMNTAISGLDAQSAAFSNIGDNVANSQTVGFKQVDTSFEDYLSTSSQSQNQSGAVVAAPEYSNDVQGTVTQTGNALNLAISGAGFFAVEHPVGESNTGTTAFAPETEYTREGDFTLNKDGYIVNASGDFLTGWAADATGALDQTKTVPIQIGQAGDSPVPTKNATLAANLPASPDGSAISTQIPVTDALGRQQTLNLSWTPVSGTANQWTVSVAQGDTGASLGTATVSFGSVGNPAAPEGTISGISGTTGSLSGSTFSTGGTATLGMTVDYGAGPQPIALDLGHFGQSDGLTQYAGTTYSLRSLTQDGVAPGSYSGVTMQKNGNVVVNYDNGQSRVVAQVPLTTFADPDALQHEDGQAFQATKAAGAPQTVQSGSNGAGSLVASSVESSNVDIASEFTKLIVAQQAYSANTKMVTTADQLLQTTINMKQ